MEIWINPVCSKCQTALSLLDAEKAQYTVRHYLQEPPTADELDAVLRRLALEPWDITRLGEPVATELGLATWPRETADRIRWIETLAAHRPATARWSTPDCSCQARKRPYTGAQKRLTGHRSPMTDADCPRCPSS